MAQARDKAWIATLIRGGPFLVPIVLAEPVRWLTGSDTAPAVMVLSGFAVSFVLRITGVTERLVVRVAGPDHPIVKAGRDWALQSGEPARWKFVVGLCAFLVLAFVAAAIGGWGDDHHHGRLASALVYPFVVFAIAGLVCLIGVLSPRMWKRLVAPYWRLVAPHWPRRPRA